MKRTCFIGADWWQFHRLPTLRAETFSWAVRIELSKWKAKANHLRSLQPPLNQVISWNHQANLSTRPTFPVKPTRPWLASSYLIQRNWNWIEFNSWTVQSTTSSLIKQTPSIASTRRTTILNIPIAVINRSNRLKSDWHLIETVMEMMSSVNWERTNSRPDCHRVPELLYLHWHLIGRLRLVLRSHSMITSMNLLRKKARVNSKKCLLLRHLDWMRAAFDVQLIFRSFHIDMVIFYTRVRVRHSQLDYIN